MKTKIICLLVVLFTILCPLMMFEIQDYIDQSRSYAMPDTSIDDTLLKNHPVISSVYHEFYSSDPSNYFIYDYTDISVYDSDVQKKLIDMKKIYETEMNTLLDFKVIQPTYLHQNNDHFTLDFGSLYTSFDKGQNAFALSQIYRIHNQGSESADFVLLKDVKKISKLSFYGTLPVKSLDELKDIVWAYIQYLGLDDLDDWQFGTYGFESYAAKIQIYCEMYQIDDHQYELAIGICPIGQHSRMHTVVIE